MEWQKEAEEKKLRIKTSVNDKAKEFQSIHKVPNDVIKKFLNEFIGFIDAVNLDQEKSKAQAEMTDAKKKCNKLIDKFLTKNWNTKYWGKNTNA